METGSVEDADYTRVEGGGGRGEVELYSMVPQGGTSSRKVDSELSHEDG